MACCRPGTHEGSSKIPLPGQNAHVCGGLMIVTTAPYAATAAIMSDTFFGGSRKAEPSGFTTFTPASASLQRAPVTKANGYVGSVAMPCSTVCASAASGHPPWHPFDAISAVWFIVPCTQSIFDCGASHSAALRLDGVPRDMYQTTSVSAVVEKAQHAPQRPWLRTLVAKRELSWSAGSFPEAMRAVSSGHCEKAGIDKATSAWYAATSAGE
mmetsp:Transcript_47770/g.147361  ORF Transcript_47770/g.147361 Transcript_47770/m.147361 type:complete len:212 (-) Transcript_47770:763-1398(-)